MSGNMYDSIKINTLKNGVSNDNQINGSMVNSIGSKYKKIKTIFQLREYIDLLREIIQEKDKLESNYSNDFFKLQKKFNEVSALLRSGILITDDKINQRIIDIMIKFLKPYGVDEAMISSLSSISLFISDIKLAYDGLFVNIGNRIGIDYRYVDFNDDGYYEGLKEEYIKFLEYVLTHEFFHRASSLKHSNYMMFCDALSEGFTDMFALMATNAYEYKSKNYDFLVKICTLLANVIGFDKVLDDYLNNIDTWSNLKSFFKEMTLQDGCFEQFYMQLNEILELTMKSNQNENLIEVLNGKKEEMIVFIVDNLLISYIKNNPDKKDELTLLFDNLFNVDINSFSSGRHQL